MASLHMLDELLARGVLQDISFNGCGGTAMIAIDDQAAWSVVFGADQGELTWFVLTHGPSKVQVHVVDVSLLGTEPGLDHLATALRHGARLH